jgi:hypothetical protein
MGPSILVIDDHPAVRRGLLEILSSEFQEAGSAMWAMEIRHSSS